MKSALEIGLGVTLCHHVETIIYCQLGTQAYEKRDFRCRIMRFHIINMLIWGYPQNLVGLCKRLSLPL